MKAFRDIAMNVLSGSYNKWNVPAAGNYDGSYEQQITYDANGNITGLLRKGAGTLVASGTGGLSMDNMTYYYNTPVNAKQTNRLIGINDQAASSYSDDVHQTNVPTAGVSSTYNYDYDRRGNLVLDKSEHIAAIVWTSDGKVKSILRDNQPIAGSSPAAYPPDIDYQYDPMRQRVCKIVKPRSSGTAPGPQANWIYTYYIRDASGQVMAIYEKTFEMVSGQPHTYREKIVTKELSLYGTQRLGADNPGYTDYGNNFTAGTNTLTGEFTNITYASFSLFTPPLNLYSNARILGNKTFELANHLGNVLATVSDRKIAAANTGPGSYLVNYVMSSLPGSLDLVRVNGTDAISGAKLMCMINAVSSPAVFNLRLGSNLPAGDAYEIEFDFDKGTLSGNDQVWALAQEQGTLLPFYLPGGNAHFFFNGTIPPTGHYKFYYKPQATGTGTISSLCFYVVNAQANNFLLDNVTMRALPKVSAYNPDVLSHTDYYAGGAPMPGRRYSSSSYRYGFNGKEKDDEIKGSGNSLDFGDRVYDPRLGRWLSLDNRMRDYPSISPYAFAVNSPIALRDADGNVVVDANGNPVTVSVTQGEDGKYTATFTFAEGTTQEVMNSFNKNAGTVIQAMSSTDIGRSVVQSMVDVKQKISIRVSELTIYSDGKGHTSSFKKDGFTSLVTGETASKSDGEGGLESADIVIFEGSLKKLQKKEKMSKYTLDDLLGSTGTHEGTHATDKNSNPKTAEPGMNTETKPNENAEKHRDEIDLQKSKETGTKGSSAEEE